MSQCQFSIFCYFYVLEKLHRKYSWNWTKQKSKFLFPTRDGVQSKDGGDPRASHTIEWRSQPLAHATRWWGHLTHLLTPPFRLYILLGEKPKRPDQFSLKHTASRHRHRCEIGRVQKLFPAPVGEGNHRRRPSSSPCLPSE
jgi:hypothetical protein